MPKIKLTSDSKELLQYMAKVEHSYSAYLPMSKGGESKIKCDSKYLDDILLALRETHMMISKKLDELGKDKEYKDVNNPRLLWKVTNLYSIGCVELDKSMRLIRQQLREVIKAQGSSPTRNTGDQSASPASKKGFRLFSRLKSGSISQLDEQAHVPNQDPAGRTADDKVDKNGDVPALDTIAGSRPNRALAVLPKNRPSVKVKPKNGNSNAAHLTNSKSSGSLCNDNIKNDNNNGNNSNKNNNNNNCNKRNDNHNPGNAADINVNGDLKDSSSGVPWARQKFSIKSRREALVKLPRAKLNE